MRRSLVWLAPLALAILILMPGFAAAATSPANGASVTGIPVTFSTTDLVTSTSAKFFVDGVQVAYVPAYKILVWDETEGDYYIAGYRASAKAVIGDGPHVLEIKQGTISRYRGTFTVDADPIVVDTWWGSDGIYFKIIDNDPTIVSNYYHYDKSGTGGGLSQVSASTAGGVTTVVRKAPHGICDLVGTGYCCEIHGISLKTTDGYSYPGDNMDIAWVAYSVDEPMCAHYGGYGDPETMYEHNTECLGLSEW